MFETEREIRDGAFVLVLDVYKRGGRKGVIALCNDNIVFSLTRVMTHYLNILLLNIHSIKSYDVDNSSSILRNPKVFFRKNDFYFLNSRRDRGSE